MQKNNAHTPLRSTTILHIVALCLTLLGLLLIFASSLFGIFVLFTHSATYNTWLLANALTGAWFIWIGVTLFERFPLIVVVVRYANMISIPLLGYLYLTLSDIRYFYAGISLFWCAVLVEQTVTIHREFAMYYPGLRLVTLIGSWVMSVVALVLTIIYLLPHDTEPLSFIFDLGEQVPTVILFMGYGFLSMLRKGMTPRTERSA